MVTGPRLQELYAVVHIPHVMVERRVDESVIRADRWSKVIALFCAVGTFLLASSLTDDAQFSMIVAAFAGIGVRIYVPYHASVTSSDPEQQPIQAYEGTGNYHQGAVGAGVVVAAFVATVVMVVRPDATLATLAGAGTAVVSFVVLRAALPS